MDWINRHAPGIIIVLILLAMVAKWSGLWPDAQADPAGTALVADDAGTAEEADDGEGDIEDTREDRPGGGLQRDAGSADVNDRGTSDAGSRDLSPAERREVQEIQREIDCPDCWEHPPEPMGPSLQIVDPDDQLKQPSPRGVEPWPDEDRCECHERAPADRPPECFPNS